MEKQDQERQTVPLEGSTIPEFCTAHRFSRSMYFKMKKAGLGPVEMHVGKRVIITHEAAAEWRRERQMEGVA